MNGDLRKNIEDDMLDLQVEIEALIPLVWHHALRCRNGYHSCDDGAPEDPNVYAYYVCTQNYESGMRKRRETAVKIAALLYNHQAVDYRSHATLNTTPVGSRGKWSI